MGRKDGVSDAFDQGQPCILSLIPRITHVRNVHNITGRT